MILSFDGKPTGRRCGMALAAALLALCVLTAPASPARASGQVGNGDPASCTEAALRSALAAGGLVTFNCGPNPVTITISEDLVIDKATEIDGGGPHQGGLITLSGGGTTRVLRVRRVNFTMRNLTIRDGKELSADGRGSGLYSEGFNTVRISNSRFEDNDGTSGFKEGGAGAIYMHNGGALIIEDSAFVGNRGITGGAIYSLLSSLTVVNSTFVANDATPGGRAASGYDGRFGFGGAIYTDGASYPANNSTGGQVIIRDSIFQDNRALGQGGAVFSFVYAPDSVTISGSTFRSNRVDLNTGGYAIGGALRHGGGPLTLSDSTFVENRARTGGGALWSGRNYPAILTNVTFNANRVESADGKSGQGGALMITDGVYTLINSTIADNYADFMGGGIFSGGERVILRNTIVANNRAGDGSRIWNQCSSPLTGGGNNLQSSSIAQRDGGDYACSPGITFADPQLGPLAANGGRSPTRALTAGSRAVQAGSNCPATDQRGAARQTGCDIGAYAFGVPNPPTPLPAAPLVWAPDTSRDPFVALRWGGVAGAATYEVQTSADSSFGAGTRTVVTPLTGVTLAQTQGAFFVRVRACNAVGCGAYSSSATGAVAGSLLQVFLPTVAR